jgi:DNA modification methylase
VKKSRYTSAEKRRDNLKNLGFSYEGKIFRRSMSSYLFVDTLRESILDEYEKTVFYLIEKVKSIKTFFNYTVDKDHREIN